ncbi:hypothetical protein ACFM35_12895 [Microbacterium sp. P01]|uniref:hypothetical protein n=1 Tax=unclassified Microbacterium TaxID=2609290 RepID=UPI00366F8E61
MSTDRSTRSSRRRLRQSRAFIGAFAIVVAVLAGAALAGAAATTAQGPRVTDVQVDPAAAVAASGSRMIITTTQSLQTVDAGQVTVTPATPFTVDTSGRSVGVRFTLPLHDETAYTVTVAGLEGLGGGPAAEISQSFTTSGIDVYLLRRGQDGDTIFRTDLAGETADAVFTHEHIEDFRATSSHLVVSVRSGEGTGTNGDGEAELIVTDLDGSNARDLTLPGDGYVSNLQSADRGELIGYTFSDANLSATTGRESALFTASLKDDAADAEPTQIAVAGDDQRVAEWRFVPDTDSILLLAFSGSLLLTSATGSDPVALGNAVSIDGIARGSSHAVVERADARYAIDLTDGTEQPLVDAAGEEGLPGPVTPMPGEGGGTLRTFAEVENNTTLISTTVSVVRDDGIATPVFTAPATDGVLQTCVSPSGRYAAVLVAPDIVDNRYDAYLLPMTSRPETHIIDLSATSDDREVSILSGFDASWCQVPPR